MRDICIPVFIAVLLTITKRWELPKCLLMEERINKIGYLHSMEYYCLKNEILTHSTTWMNLEAIMLWEISHSQKDKYSK